MKQIYAPYTDWEDFKNGMYNEENSLEMVDLSKLLLEDNCLFYSTLLTLLEKWPIASNVNLTNKNSNRKAWLGHAACSFLHGVPERQTRIAWGEMTIEKKIQANLVAEKVIRIYEEKNRRVHSGVGESMLF